jgi:hypothetical protein
MPRLGTSRSKEPELTKSAARVIAALKVFLIAAVLVCAGLLAVPLWAALTASWQSAPTPPAMQRVKWRLTPLASS